MLLVLSLLLFASYSVHLHVYNIRGIASPRRLYIYQAIAVVLLRDSYSYSSSIKIESSNLI